MTRVPLDLDVQKRRLVQLRPGRETDLVTAARRGLAGGVPLIQLASTASAQIVCRRRLVPNPGPGVGVFHIVGAFSAGFLAFHQARVLVRNDGTNEIRFRLAEVIEAERFIETTITTVPVGATAQPRYQPRSRLRRNRDPHASGRRRLRDGQRATDLREGGP